MMLTGFVLAVLMQAVPSAQPPADEVRAADETPDDAYRALVRDHQAARQTLMADPKAGSDLDRWNELAARFSARAMELARRYPGQPTAFKALTWIVDRGDVALIVEEALRILARDHGRDPAMGPFCRYLFRAESKAAEGLLRRVIDENPDRAARAQASYSLACNLASAADQVRQKRLNPRTGGFLDNARWLKGLDPDALDREANALLGRLIDQYADVQDGRGPMGVQARAYRDAIRDLAVGKEAPEIVGEDLDGKPMKLSDYRGKVVVLDFTSHEYCGPCRAMYPSERKLVERLKDRPFALLAVNCDDHRELVKKARSQGEITWRCWWDGGSTHGPIATRWNIPGWPTVFVLDHRGIIRYKGMLFDAMDMAAEALLRDYDREKAAEATPRPVDLPASIDFDEVVRAAAAIPYDMPRADVLFETGLARAKVGDQAVGQALQRDAVDRVRKAIDSWDAGSRGFVFLRLASLQDRLGDQTAARDSIARAIAVTPQHCPEVSWIGVMEMAMDAQVGRGDYAGALETSRTLASTSRYIDCLVEIAEGQAKAGDVAGALDTASKIRAVSARDRTRKETHPQTIAFYDLILAETLAEVALAQAKPGETGIAAARETIRAALELVDRSLAVRADVGAPALAQIALAQAKIGDHEGSRKSFERAIRANEDLLDFPAAEILAKIAEARWKAGETAEARSLLREAFERSGPLDNQYPQVNTIIVQVQLAVGDLDGALRTARASINERGELILDSDTIRRLVRAHAAAIGPRPALAEWLKSARSPMLRAWALLGAAEAAAPTKPAVNP